MYLRIYFLIRDNIPIDISAMNSPSIGCRDGSTGRGKTDILNRSGEWAVHDPRYGLEDQMLGNFRQFT